MKTLMGWIVGVFALGLVAGSLYRSTAADSEPDRGSLENALRSTPSVDCGAGRQAVLAPIPADGGTAVQIKCVPTSPVRERVVAAAAPTPAFPPVVAASREEPALATSSSTSASSETPRVPATAEKSSRSAKDHALIIGGAAGAGAGIGAIAKGKKGAAVGAAIGGVAGTVYDVLTRNKN